MIAVVSSLNRDEKCIVYCAPAFLLPDKHSWLVATPRAGIGMEVKPDGTRGNESKICDEGREWVQCLPRAGVCCVTTAVASALSRISFGGYKFDSGK